MTKSGLFRRIGGRRQASDRASRHRGWRCETLESRTMLAGDPVINEFLASNDGGITDGYGDASDWIEIYNAGDAAIDLAGWYLTDDAAAPTKWQFPDTPAAEIAAGEHLVVFASNSFPGALDPLGNLHTNFQLSAGGEYVALVMPDGATVVSEFGAGGAAYPQQFTDVSYGPGNDVSTTTLVASGAAVNTIVPTATTDAVYGNTWKGGDEAGFLAAGGLTGWTSGGTTGVGYDDNPDYQSQIGTNVAAAMQNVNTSVYLRIPFTVADPAQVTAMTLRMLYDDGYIAYLNGQEISRQFYTGAPAWNSFASTANHEADAFEEYDVSAFRTALVAGDNILAIHGLNRTADSSDFLILPELVATVVSGVTEVGYLPVPTPGEPNSGSVQGFVEDTQFSVTRGFFDAPFDVTIASDTPGATIVYTTDGSTPSAAHGTAVVAADANTPPAATVHIAGTTTLRAVAVKDGFQPTNVDTQTYLFLGQVAQQSNAQPGYPATWATIAADYQVDPDVTDNPLYQNTFVDDLKSVPTISLVTDVGNLFDPTTGIYVNPEQRGVAWERPVSVEFLNFDGQSAEQIDAGVRIFGGVSRTLSGTPKKSFRLQFKSIYGAAKLDFPFFEDTDVAEFDRLMLRGGYNYKWTHNSATQQTRADYIRDQFSRESGLAMGQPQSHGRYVHVYINGLYWGMYNAVERPDESFAEAHFGGAKEDYDVIKHGNPPDATAGDQVAWDAMFAIAKDPQRTADQKYVDIQEYLDIDNLIDYIIMTHYTGNVDAPVLIGNTEGPRNFYAIRPREPGGQFKFYLWDSEHTLSETSVDRTELGVGNADLTPARLYGELRGSATFRLQFADRVHLHFFNEGALTPQASIDRYLAIAAQIDRAIVGESARWGDTRRATPYTRDAEWLAEIHRLTTQFFPARNDVVLNQWRADSLYPSVVAPTYSQHGGPIVSGFELSMSAPAGQIYYTLDGRDPRDAATNAPSAAAVLWDGAPIALSTTTQVKARVHSGGVWSAANDAVFRREESPPLRISELMYHPPDAAAGNGRDLEYVEVVNVGGEPLHVRNIRFSAGIDFTFPDETLAAGERALIVRNQAVYLAHYGGAARILGEYTGQLDNGGERLRLEGAFGETILDFRYDDGWHDITDGEGYSLVILDVTADQASWGRAASWRASETVDGSPGTVDNGFAPGIVVVNEVSAGGTTAAGNWIELRNLSTAPLDVGGWWLSDDAIVRNKFAIPAGAVIPPGGYAVFSEATDFGPGANPGVGISLGAVGGSVYLSSPGNAAGVGGYRESESLDGSRANLSYGRYVNSTGDADFVPLVSPTPGGANSDPLVGGVVVNEIMYNPADARPEYLELFNATGAAVPLFDVANPGNTWQLTNGVSFAFPPGVTLAGGGYAIVTAVDEATFRGAYAVPAGVPVFGPYVGALDNAGERVELSMPLSPAGGLVPYLPIDQIRYNNKLPWPVAADGGGAALNRVFAALYGNDPLNWAASNAGGTPGAANVSLDATPPLAPGGLSAMRASDTQIRLAWQPSLDPQSGVSGYNVYLNGLAIGTTSATTFNYAPDFASATHAYQVSAINGDGIESARSAALPVATANLLGGDDTYIAGGAATTSYGDVEVLVLEQTPGAADRDRRVLLRWDVSSVPSGATVLDGSVMLDVLRSPAEAEYVLVEVKRAWSEAAATWNSFAAGSAWQTPGGDGPDDRGNTALGRATISAGGMVRFALNAEGVAVANRWLADPATNRGMMLVAASALGGGQSGAPEPPPVAPVIHWPFDGNLSNVGSGGSQYNATVVGPAAVFVPGMSGSALDLQNVGVTSTGGQYVSVGYQLPDRGTIALWYYVDPYYNFQSIFDNSVNQDDWELWVYSDGRIRGRVDNNSGQVTYDVDNLSGPNNWYHVAYSWDRTDPTTNAAQLYVNGSLVATDDIPVWVTPGTTFYLGGGNDGNTYATGNFDDVRIYDYVLSADEVQFVAGATPEEPDLADGLVSYWPLDDGAANPLSTVAVDAVGANDGALGGFSTPPTWLSSAKIGGGLDFDGANDHVLVPNSPSLNPATNAVTLAAWVNLDLLPSQIPDAFAGIYDSESDAYILYEDRGANELRFKVTDADGTAERPGIPAALLSTGTWHLVVGVYDGGAGEARIYLDGNLADTHANAGLTGVVLSGQTAALGRNGAGAVYPFQGAIDEVALWSRALSPVEIAALWNDGLGTAILGGGPEPVVYLPFDGNLANAGTLGAAVGGVLVDGANGQTPAYVTTDYGQGLDLTNSGATGGDFVSISHALADRGAAALWYFVEDFATTQTIFDNSAGPDHWEMFVDTAGVLRFRIGDGSGDVSFDLDQLGGPNQWYHVAVAWDRQNATDSAVKLFVNGALVDSGDIAAWTAPGDTFYLAGGDDANAYGSGVWDELRIYDEAVSDFSIASLVRDAVFAAPLVLSSSESQTPASRPKLTLTYVLPDTTPPRVRSLMVRGTAWSPAVSAQLQIASLGEASGGYAVPVAAAGEVASLPWANIDAVSFLFTEQVAVSTVDLSVVGQQSGAAAIDSVSFSPGAAPGTFIATWRLTQPLAADRYTIVLSDNVVDLSGVALDGDWPSASNSYPSGDGTPGGAFAIAIDVLPGDINGDGRVGLADVAAAHGNYGAAGVAALLGGDLNADGVVSRADVAILAANFGRARSPSSSASSASAPAAIVASPRRASAVFDELGARARDARRRRSLARDASALSAVDAVLAAAVVRRWRVDASMGQ